MLSFLRRARLLSPLPGLHLYRSLPFLPSTSASAATAAAATAATAIASVAAAVPAKATTTATAATATAATIAGLNNQLLKATLVLYSAMGFALLPPLTNANAASTFAISAAA